MLWSPLYLVSIEVDIDWSTLYIWWSRHLVLQCILHSSCIFTFLGKQLRFFQIKYIVEFHIQTKMNRNIQTLQTCSNSNLLQSCWKTNFLVLYWVLIMKCLQFVNFRCRYTLVTMSKLWLLCLHLVYNCRHTLVAMSTSHCIQKQIKIGDHHQVVFWDRYGPANLELIYWSRRRIHLRRTVVETFDRQSVAVKIQYFSEVGWSIFYRLHLELFILQKKSH